MAIDWSKIWGKYRGLWVALKEDEVTVIASAKTAKEAWEKARKKGYQKPILTRMPKDLTTYIGCAHEISVQEVWDRYLKTGYSY